LGSLTIGTATVTPVFPSSSGSDGSSGGSGGGGSGGGGSGGATNPIDAPTANGSGTLAVTDSAMVDTTATGTLTLGN
jgi:hypothetical protein